MRARWFIVIGTAAVVGLTGCGDGSSQDVSSRSTAPSDTAASPSAAVSVGAAAGLSGACTDGLAFSRAYGSALAGGSATAGPGGLPNVDAVKASFTAAIKVAPAEIKSELQLLGDAYLPFFDAMVKANYDYSKIDPKVFEIVSTPAVTAAAQKVSAFYLKTCS